MLKALRTTKSSFTHIASIACAIHCLVTPFIVIAIPFLGSFFESHWVEISLLSFSILCGIAIIYRGYCTHKKEHSVVLFMIGISFWILHTVLEHHHHWSTELYLFLGTGLVLLSYYINHKYLHCCHHHHHN